MSRANWYWTAKRRQELRRLAKLRQKAQKASAINRLEEIQERPTWNKRFAAVQALRAATE